MYLFAILALLGCANSNVIRNNENLPSLDLFFVQEGLLTAAVGNIYLGTPKRGFAVQFDTLYGDSIVPSAKCSQDFCKTHQFYNASESSTYEPNGTPFVVEQIPKITYHGFLSTDMATIGDLVIPEQTFGEIVNVSEDVPQGISPDGIFGLGFNQQKTIVDNFVALGLIEKPIFSTYLKKDSKKSGPKIIFGGSDSELYNGDLQYTTVYGFGPTWQIAFSGVQVGNDRASKGDWYAALSLANNFIIGPVEDVAAINEAIGANKYSQIDCSKVSALPNVQLYLGEERVLVLGPEDYIFKLDSEDVCLTAFVGAKPEPQQTYRWILGLPVLSKFYTEFDAGNRRIGFSVAH